MYDIVLFYLICQWEQTLIAAITMSDVGSASDLSLSRMMRMAKGQRMERGSKNDGHTFLSLLLSVRKGDGGSRCHLGQKLC